MTNHSFKNIIQSNHSILHKLSSRGVMTITTIASLMSLPLVRYLYLMELASRQEHNLYYRGAPGGEVLIPIIIFVIGLFISLEIDRKRGNRYAKYKKH